MSIETKLDRIIELLERIESRIQPHGSPEVQTSVVPVKPTKSQLKFKHMIEFAAEMERKFYVSAIRKHVSDCIEIRKNNPDWCFPFNPNFISKIDEKIKRYGTQFYVDLKVWSENFSHAVEAEAEKVLERAARKFTTTN